MRSSIIIQTFLLWQSERGPLQAAVGLEVGLRKVCGLLACKGHSCLFRPLHDLPQGACSGRRKARAQRVVPPHHRQQGALQRLLAQRALQPQRAHHVLVSAARRVLHSTPQQVQAAPSHAKEKGTLHTLCDVLPQTPGVSSCLGQAAGCWEAQRCP